ncbi:DJ-1/PfpI family protein [Campylobacter sp. CCUG 57310]|uniref:DJ-1/PfpI family protein n=1 Tax=Campylobacter sp. CCUG 57310 TaxID=2517362 RepID=UPI001566658C|nr:DJ-1/PfpI family protein [Campylobacter sp. CCUG 57310]QKF91850.1 glutamine amidotransferase-like domain-containing protein [Campylobacter sp. CCUG 57310]
MKTAIVIYDKINLLSFAQIWQMFSADLRSNVKICAFKSEIVDEHGLKISPEIYGESLYGYDCVIVPDGMGALGLRYDEIFLSWIKSASSARHKIAFDLGALIYAGAGFLEGKKACVRAGYKNALKEYCEFDPSPVCISDDIITVCSFGAEFDVNVCTMENLKTLKGILNL